MAERRKYPRIRTKFPCDLHLPGASVKATIRDVSEGGLSVLCDIDEPEQGEPISLTLHPPNRPSVELSCVFWHSRRVRVVGEGRSTAHLGLVVSNPSDPYFDLVVRLRGKKPHRREKATEPSPKTALEPQAQKPGSSAGEATLKQFSVRVKQDGGPRSTRLVVAARDIKDAEARALAEVGDGWIALEVKRAKTD
jgi:hypothetical protein